MSRVRLLSAGLLVLLVLDVALVASALRPPSAPPASSAALAGAEGSTPSTGPGRSPARSTAGPSTAGPSTTGPSTTGPTSPAPVTGVRLARLIDATSPTVAWRAVVGSCAAGGAGVERSTDGGRSWERAGTDRDVVLRLKATDDRAAFLVAAGADCDPVFLRSTDGGGAWDEQPTSLDAAWYLDPDDPAAIHGPQGTRPGPCGAPVVDLVAVTSTRASALCPDGRVTVSTDAGAAWAAVAAVPGAVALTDTGADGHLVAVLGAPGCAGVQVVEVGPGGAASATGCVEASSPQPSLVALSAAGGALWLWVQDAVHVSGDLGRTWEERTGA